MKIEESEKRMPAFEKGFLFVCLSMCIMGILGITCTLLASFGAMFWPITNVEMVKISYMGSLTLLFIGMLLLCLYGQVKRDEKVNK